MTSLSKTLVTCFTLAIFASLLSSCANNTNFGINPDTYSTQKAENSSSETDDVQLENVESKSCHDEELVALSRTGAWDEKMSWDKSTLTAGSRYKFPVVFNKKVDMYLNLFQTTQRDTFSRWLAKSAMYRPLIEKELAAAGLPKDLLYLAMIESGYNQLACSSANAVGLWQFMQATGEEYDLQVDKYVDERRDPVKSTKAAVTYLSDLYQEFNDWHLAVAAYNGGPGTIRNGLKLHNVDNFWDLASKDYLALETKRYVPKLIAALLIAKDPAKYGFTDIAYAAPVHYDTISVGPGMSLEAIALISNSTTQQIRSLNQELRLGKTPLNTAQYEVKIPEATADLAARNLSRLQRVVNVDYKTYKVAKGDTLSKISNKYNVSKTTLLQVNNLRSKKLAYGRSLRIPYNTISYQLLPEGASGAKTAYKNGLVLHRIKKGETLSGIADLYHVPPQVIVSWNKLKSSHAIRAGQQLSLYVNRPGTKQLKSVVTVASNKTIKSISPRLHKTLLSQPVPESPFAQYSVQDGDSLWTISRKFSASTAEIKKWNNLTSDLIQPGSILKLKKV